jgi:hypothetical protein
MTEDEREDLVYRLLEEFKQSIGSAFDDKLNLGFTTGARAALFEMKDYPVPPPRS